MFSVHTLCDMANDNQNDFFILGLGYRCSHQSHTRLSVNCEGKHKHLPIECVRVWIIMSFPLKLCTYSVIPLVRAFNSLKSFDSGTSLFSSAHRPRHLTYRSCPTIKSFVSFLYDLFSRDDGATPLTFMIHIFVAGFFGCWSPMCH